MTTEEETTEEETTVEETTEETSTEEITTEEETTETPLGENVQASSALELNGTPLEASEVYVQDTYYKTSKGYPMAAAMDLPIENSIGVDSFYGYDYSPTYMTRLKVNALYIIIDDNDPVQINMVKQSIISNGEESDGKYPEVALGFNAGYMTDVEVGEHTVSYMAEIAWNEKWCDGNTDTIYSVTTPEKTVKFVDDANGDVVCEATTQYMSAYKGSVVKSIYGGFSVPSSSETISSFKIYKHATKEEISYKVLNKFAWTSTWATCDSRYGDMGKFGAYQLFEADSYRAGYSADIQLNEDIPECDYDIVYTTSKSRKFTNERAYRATKKTIVYDVRETSIISKNSNYDATPVFSDNSGDYVSVFVYGLNLTKANVPTFYEADSSNVLAQYLADDKGCGEEAWEYGFDYSLKKTGSFHTGNSYPVRVSGEDVLYVENYSVKEKELTYQYNIELVNRSELNTKEKYFRIYFSEGTVTEGEKIDVIIKNMAIMDSGNVSYDGEEYYVEFAEGTDMYAGINNYIEYSWYDVVATSAGGKSSTFEIYNIQKAKTVTNITVPANCSWEIHSAKDVGSIIYNGSTTVKKAVLTDSQIAKLKNNHLYRVCIYDKNGDVISGGRYLTYFTGTELYSITYELDGGTNHPDNPTEYGKNDTYTLKAPTKAYHTFAGWYSDANFKTKVTSIPKGSKGDKTFYAKWEPYTYTIAYNANGGTGKVNATLCKYDVEATIAKNAFTRTGYTFKEWNTKSDGTGDTYQENNIVRNLTEENKKTITLYAIWKPITYTVILDKNSEDATEGTLDENAEGYVAEYGETICLTGDEFVRTGYTIASWNTKPDGKGKKVANGEVTNLTATEGDTITLYAQWAIKNYTITYDYDGGKVKKANPKSYTCETADITLNNPEKTGYVFEGYFTEDPHSEEFTGDEEPVSVIPKGSNGDLHLYAKWRPISYTIIFKDSTGAEYGDGFNEENARVEMEYNDMLIFTDNLFVKKGYTLSSWNSKENGKGTKYLVGRGYQNLTTEDGKEIIVYAQWT
ncbi:MAG: InlB B-repeat-containing protein, partial [Lachnospiraceae bacterium]